MPDNFSSASAKKEWQHIIKDSDKFFSEHNDLPKHADTVILQVDNNSDKNSLKKNSNSDFESEKLSSSEESQKSHKNFINFE